MLVDGFNELVFHYSQKKQPLGLEIHFHRIKQNGSVVVDASHWVPFHNQKQFITAELEHLKKCFVDDRLRFKELKRMFEETTSNSVRTDVFENLICEAKWFGMIDIENPDTEPEDWILRRRWS